MFLQGYWNVKRDLKDDGKTEAGFQGSLDCSMDQREKHILRKKKPFVRYPFWRARQVQPNSMPVMQLTLFTYVAPPVFAPKHRQLLLYYRQPASYQIIV